MDSGSGSENAGACTIQLRTLDTPVKVSSTTALLGEPPASISPSLVTEGQTKSPLATRVSAMMIGEVLFLLFIYVKGAGSLFPWYSLITSVDYFMLLFPSFAANEIELRFTTTFITSVFLGVMSMSFFGHRLSLKMKLVPGFTIFTLALAFFPALGLLQQKSTAY